MVWRRSVDDEHTMSLGGPQLFVRYEPWSCRSFVWTVSANRNRQGELNMSSDIPAGSLIAESLR